MKWLVDPQMAMPSVIIMSVWRGLGFNIVIFLAGSAEHSPGSL